MRQRRTLYSALLCGLLLCPTAAMSESQPDADGTTFKARKKFQQIGYSYNTFSRKDGAQLKNNIGVSFTSGRSYYLHKPIAGRLRIGLDWAWTDINYASYKVNYIYTDAATSTQSEAEDDDSDDDRYTNLTMHGVDIGMQIGPSVTYAVTNDIQLHAYGRYAPAFSLLYDGDHVQGGFGNFCVIGANVSWKCIGLGIEGRFGGSTYKNLDSGDEPEDYADFVDDGIHIAPNEKGKTTYSGFRAYITFRF